MTSDSVKTRLQERDGLTAIYRSRADADLAVERLAQEHGVDPAFIYVEPVDAENSAGTETSGGDHASGAPSHGERLDAPLHGAIQVTFPVDHDRLESMSRALHETGAVEIEVF